MIQRDVRWSWGIVECKCVIHQRVNYVLDRSQFLKSRYSRSITTSPFIDTALSMVRPIVKPTEPLKQKRGRPTRRATKRAKWGDNEESESVWFLMKPEAGKRPEIYLSDVGSVGKPAFGRWNYLQFDPAKSWIALYLNQVSPWPKFFLLPQTSVFLSLFLVQVRRFFHRQYPWSFSFPPTFPHRVQRFFINWFPCPVFLLSLL